MTYSAVELVFTVGDVTALFAVPASAVGAGSLGRLEAVLVEFFLRKQHRLSYHHRQRQQKQQQNIIIHKHHDQSKLMVNCQHHTVS